MSTKNFLVACVLGLLILIGYNLVIARLARTSQRQHLLMRLHDIPAEANCVFLGNSLVEAGCDMEAFAKALTNSPEMLSLRPVNLALGATSPVEHYLILREALREHPHVRYVVYGFFDDQLQTIPRGEWSELVGNRALSFYFPESAAAMYAPGAYWKRWQLQLTGKIPMLAERSSLWGKVETLRHRLGDIGMPPHRVNRFGRVDDFSALEAADVTQFDARCTSAIRGQAGFSPAVQGILTVARENGARVILVEMPMPTRHRKLFYSTQSWQDLQRHVRNSAQDQGAVYVEASDWVTADDYFEDATHLSADGARFFSARLASHFATSLVSSNTFAKPASVPALAAGGITH